MVRTSPQTEQLDEAFAKAQAKFEAAVKVNTNPAFKSKYADVSSIIDATLEHLNAEGIGLRQHPSLEYKQVGEGVEAYVTVTTRLSYKGQWEESDLSLPAVQRDRFDAQSCGSALTYACRYALQGILVVRREDDDGNAATGRGSHDAAQEIAKTKIEDLKAGKQPEAIHEPTASLFYVWNDESQTATILGDEGYKSANRDLLKPLWNGAVKAIVANAEQLDTLRYQFEQRKVPFSKLQSPKTPKSKTAELADLLEKSIEIEKAKKTKREPGEDGKPRGSEVTA